MRNHALAGADQWKIPVRLATRAIQAPLRLATLIATAREHGWRPISRFHRQGSRTLGKASLAAAKSLGPQAAAGRAVCSPGSRARS